MRLWLFALGILCIILYSIFSSERRHVCLSKDEDFHLYYGDDVRHLESIEAFGWKAGGVWPIANPMLFKNSLGSVDGYLSSPSLHVHKGFLYILFKICSCTEMGCDVGVAKSTDEGHSWEYMGRAESMAPISGAMASSRLSLIQSHESRYLTVSENGEVTVYEFGEFPSHLREGKKMQGVSAGFEHARVTWHPTWKWMMLATKGPSFSWEQRPDEISVFFSKKDAMAGWKGVKVAGPPSQMQHVADGGDMYIHNATHSYRIVSVCSAWGECSGLRLRRMYLHRIRDSKKLVYSERDVNEKSGSNVFERLSGPKGDVLRYASIARLPSGKVMMVGSSKKRPDYAMHLKLYLLQSLEYIGVAYFIALACCGTIVMASYLFSVSSHGTKINTKKSKMKTGVEQVWGRMSKSHPLHVFGGISALLSIALLLRYALYYSRLHQPFYKESRPIQVAGKFSHFTLMTMSYSKRASLLDGFIRFYSQCPSVGSIIIVWNGDGVESIRHLQTSSRKPPVSIRVEHKGSMNNRYRPDTYIGTRGVLILDDDLRIPCGSIEAAFAAWRREPHRLVGWYPRLVQLPQATYHGEPETMASSKYNLILTGAAFIDHTTYFSKYWSKKYAKLRDLVDRKKNCDDILMNFVVASSHRETKPVVQYMRPERLIDLSHTTGVGISHDEKDFIRKAEACLKEFEKVFGDPLKTNTFPASGFKRPVCNSAQSKLFCSYHS